MGLYAFTRELLSDRIVRDLKKQKLGGPGTEVCMDCYRLSLKTASNVEEFWIIGFIEPVSSRSRAYLTNDVRVDTVALFIAKTVARHSTLLTPYYHQVGWEWLDKFFDHQRLRKDKLRSKIKETNPKAIPKRRDQVSGFQYMWQQIKELELIFMKMGEKTKRLKKIKTYLQGYLDELVWRIEYRNINQKRNFLVQILTTEAWGKFSRRLLKIKKRREQR